MLIRVCWKRLSISKISELGHGEVEMHYTFEKFIWRNVMHYELWWSFVKVQKEMQIADGALAPFWGTASVEIGLHLCTGDFLFLCFARLPDPPCAPSITNEANLFWPTDPCNVQRTNLASITVLDIVLKHEVRKIWRTRTCGQSI